MAQFVFALGDICRYTQPHLNVCSSQNHLPDSLELDEQTLISLLLFLPRYLLKPDQPLSQLICMNNSDGEIERRHWARNLKYAA